MPKLIKKYIAWYQGLTLAKKMILLILTFAFGWLILTRFTNVNKNTARYQTAYAEKGVLIVTVTGSGQVSTANNGTISTLATGVVSSLYAKDGDEVLAGDKIADINLDLQGRENSSQAWSSYQSAKNNLETARIALYTLQSDMITQWDKFYGTATNSTYQNSDGSPNTTNRALPEFVTLNANWLASEAKYKNQQNIINQAQTALNAAWLSYQQTSSTIYAPISGIISGLSLQEGSVIVANTNTTNSAQSATKIANIKTKALPMVSINLTEIDIPKVTLGDKATVKFDAITDKSFTGKVISIDTAGSVNSGVTTYPTVIRLDTESNMILPNMAASANIITATKNDVLIVPSAAVKKQIDGTTYVQILKNGKPQDITVETGLSSPTETEILSGISEGQIVITGTISSATNQSGGSQTQSPFGGFGSGRNVIRFNR